MSNLSKYKDPQQHLSEADMIRYKEGQMTDAEMHEVEKHLLDCDLCNDAYEGFLTLETNEYLEGIHQLKAKFNTNNSSKTSAFPWKWIAAASILLIMLLSFGLMFTVGPLNDETITEREVQDTSNKVIENELVVAENIQDTILNHHIVLNEPSVVEKRSSQSNPRPTESATAPGKEPQVLDKKTKKEEEEILVLAESFPLEMETVAVEDQEVEEILQDRNFSSDAPASNADLKSETRARNSKIIYPGSYNLISGKVVDDAGEPLPGVNVIVKGTNKGTITDVWGNFKLPLEKDEKVLVYSFIGYTSEEKEILNDQEQIVELKPDMMALSEVVVVGYGTSSSSPINNVEEKINPKPLMGMRKYRKALKENIKYPEAALENNIEGSVILQFEVNADGSLSDFYVIKSLGYGLDDEAIRLVKEGSQWKPATLNGNPVRETVKLRIPFRINK